jgi:dienelactone hydrolase/pimeloyl-ACP methyl ester carboxylesterase
MNTTGHPFRRRATQATRCGLFLLFCWLITGPGSMHIQAASAAGDDTLQPLHRYPRMVHEYFVRQVRQVEDRANRQRARLQNRTDAEAYLRDVRAKIRACFGPWPEKTALRARVTGTVERDTYRIEKVIFESRPGFLVTANLYIPTNRPLPLPGVVGTCGHSSNGKAAEPYQAFAQGLARQGYVVLIYDPIGQGERLQYPDRQLKSRIGAGVYEHLYAGNQQFLVGEFFGAWRAWDGIRALDYLLTRSEVDPRRIGVTGNSGGGTMTTWLCGLEERWTMAAPSCFVTTFRHNLENELPADTEQCPPRALALGLDHADFIAAMAPKPVILLSKEKDFFDIRGTEQAFVQLQHLYRLFQAESNITLFTGPGSHGYSQENREAMYRWFNRATGISDASAEPELIIEEDETLWCTPRGQVSELQSRPVHVFTRDRSRVLARQRPNALSEQELQQRLRTVLCLPPTPAETAPPYRVLQAWPSRKYPRPHTGTYAVETEPGIQAVVTLLADERVMSRPRGHHRRAILYVAHRSSDRELRSEPLVRELLAADPNAAFYACDVRGIGESLPNTGQKPFHDLYGSDYMYAIHALMLDRPYLGQKTYDVLRVLDWLKACGHPEVHLAGQGWGALSAAFAAVLSDPVTQVTLKHALTSYTEIAESEAYAWPLSTLLPNVLKEFDLPDCYRMLQKKRLRQIEPWSADPEHVPGGLQPVLRKTF